MSHASRKRLHQEPGHQVAHHRRNNKHYLNGYKDSVGAGMPNKGKNINSYTKKDEEDHESFLWNKMATLQCTLTSFEPGFIKASEIKLHNLKFGMAEELVSLDFDETFLKFETPPFSASVKVEIPPLPAGATIQVGWIQVCTEMQFIYTYEDLGVGSWEIPEIVSGKYKMVSDADGTLYPWYGSTTEVEQFEGPTNLPTLANIYMNDNFYSKIQWSSHSGYSDAPSLTYVNRKQRFYTFLALKDVDTNICQIIKTLTWSFEVTIDVNPKKPLEKRAKLLKPINQESPKDVPLHLSPYLESNALNPPCVNDCQIHVWRSKYGNDKLLEDPLNSTMTDLNKYLIDTEYSSYITAFDIV